MVDRLRDRERERPRRNRNRQGPLERVKAGKAKTGDWKWVLENELPSLIALGYHADPAIAGERRYRRTEERVLAAYGLGGYLVRFLNGRLAKGAVGEEGLRGRVLEALKNGEWQKATRFLAEAAAEGSTVGTGAMVETLVFASLRWKLWWCDHGKHYYVSDYRRKEDCPAHQAAGRQARYRRGSRAAGPIRRSPWRALRVPP